MSTARLIKLIFLLTFLASNIFAQNDSLLDSLRQKKLYDFMKVAIRQLELKKTYGLSNRPDLSPEINNARLTQFLIDSVSLKEIWKFDSIADHLPIDSMPRINPNIPDPKKCLTNRDIESMLENKASYPTFMWKESELGFSSKNRKDIYSFSPPIFNSDKSLALLLIRYSCSLPMCGNGDIYLFKKVQNEWRFLKLMHWDV